VDDEVRSQFHDENQARNEDLPSEDEMNGVMERNAYGALGGAAARRMSPRLGAMMTAKAGLAMATAKAVAATWARAAATAKADRAAPRVQQGRPSLGGPFASRPAWRSAARGHRH
jgi:hypothetical protein